jgi:methylmalonyl-CoA/ethylmalonyl-CoA epimerase
MRLEKIRQVAVGANDLDASIAFYRDKLGARFIAKYEPPGLAFFDFDGTRLLLERGASNATLYFWVDDIDAAWQEMKDNGIAFEGEPHMIFKDEAGAFGPAGEGEWMAFFKDPADNLLALASRK